MSMNTDFVLLYELGVGWVSVRHSEIVLMETQHCGATRIHLSLGGSIIVEEDQCSILRKISALTELADLADNQDTTQTILQQTVQQQTIEKTTKKKS